MPLTSGTLEAANKLKQQFCMRLGRLALRARCRSVGEWGRVLNSIWIPE